MKNLMIKSLTLLVSVVMLGIVSFARAPKRIDFAKEGSPSLVWEERVAANSSKSFVFYAKKGQKLSLSFVDDTKQGSMDLGKYSVEGNGDPLEMDIEIPKDYTFSVSNNSNKATSFRIFITLEDAKSSAKPTAVSSNNSTSPNTERVKFPAGSIEVNLERTVPANNAKRFVFNAREGQEINFTVTPARKGATLSIDFFDNEVKTGKLFTMEVPKTGDYTIQILNNDDRDQAFTLDLGIADADRTSDASNTSGNPNSTAQSGGVRVKFATGETSASVTRDIPANGSVELFSMLKKGRRLATLLVTTSKTVTLRHF